MDVRALEAIHTGDVVEDEGADEGDEFERPDSRLWVIQCKRERRLGPSNLGRIVQEAAPFAEAAVYGLIIAAACDFSKRARDTAIEAARRAGVQEIIFWSKAELEDLLYQPKNDHLLFAYFGISLQVRRRSLRTNLRGLLATKRKAIQHFGDVTIGAFTTVLIRNASNEDYPLISDPEAFKARPEWKFYSCVGHPYPNHLAFTVHKYLALCNSETEEWDVYLGHDDGQSWQQAASFPEETRYASEEYGRAHAYWSSKPDNARGWFIRRGLIHYNDILAIDEHGDAFHPGPHILVELNNENGLFTRFSDIVKGGSGPSGYEFLPTEEKKVRLFPDTFPDPLPSPEV